jgi:hypothetical protein
MLLFTIIGLILASFTSGYILHLLLKDDKWEGYFNLLCENDNVFTCHANTSAIERNKIELTTSSGISKIILMEVPGGKLPLLEIRYEGLAYSYHLRRSGNNVELTLLKTVEPWNTPTGLMLYFEIGDNKWVNFTVLITKKA